MNITFYNILYVCKRVAVQARHLHIGIVHVHRCLLPCLHIDIAALKHRALSGIIQLKDSGKYLGLDHHQFLDLAVYHAFDFNKPFILVRVFGRLRTIAFIVLRDTEQAVAGFLFRAEQGINLPVNPPATR